MSDVGTTHGTNLFVKEGWEGKMSALASSFGLRGEYPPICKPRGLRPPTNKTFPRKKYHHNNSLAHRYGTPVTPNAGQK